MTKRYCSHCECDLPKGYAKPFCSKECEEESYKPLEKE